MTEALPDSSHLDPSDLVGWAAVATGGTLAYLGLRQGGPGGLILAAGAGALVLAGLAGRAVTPAQRATRQGIEVARAATIGVAPERLYGFWRQLENLPQFMDHLESVTTLDERRSRWVAKGPAGTEVSWEAEVTEDVPNSRIAWRSLPDAQVPNEGSVEFRAAPQEKGTEVLVRLSYRPPGGALGAAFARLFGEEPGQLVEDDLRRIKRLLEVGLQPSNEGQASGRKTPLGRAAAATYDNRRTT